MSGSVITHSNGEQFFISHDHVCIRVMHEDLKDEGFVPCTTPFPTRYHGEKVETATRLISMMKEDEEQIEVCETCKHRFACTSTLPGARIHYVRENFPQYMNK